MKRVTENCIVLDDESNRVGFMRPGSLAKVDSIQYPGDGFVKGAISLTYESKKFIYLWFSSGSIILVDGSNFKILS